MSKLHTSTNKKDKARRIEALRLSISRLETQLIGASDKGKTGINKIIQFFENKIKEIKQQ